MATHGFGTLLKIDADGNSSYETTVAEVTSIDSPDMETTVSDAWNLASSSAVKTFVAGMVDPGECRVGLRFTKAQYNTFLGYLRTAKPWQIVFPESSTLAFSGFFKTLGGPKVGEDDAINQECVIKVSGAVTFTAG